MSQRFLNRPVVAGLLILIVCAAGALTLAGRQSAAVKPLPRSVQLKAPDAQRLATAARNGVTVEMPAGLELKLWASDELIVDPVALEFDDKGTLYATSTSRNNMPLDIREHPTWVPTVHTLKTVSDLREFYRRELAPDRSNQNKWLPDLNQDGSHDERDLAELKDRVYRIRDTDGDGIADSSQILIEGFNADPTFDVAGGLLYNQGDLLVGIAPGIYRLKDDNGDGTIDRQITISEGYTIHPAFGGHGISGLTMGPDGRLYWEVGDIGYDVTDKSGKRWSQHNQGGVFRSDPDGSNFEVFATGIRNLQEFSFDKYGNLISVDNDGDHQGETERLVYIPEGSDSGWRSNWQYGKYTDSKNNRYNVWMDENMFKPRFAGQAAHIIPPVAAYHSGPSGMVYNPGTALSEEWNDTFFVTSFPGAASNARVYAFKLKEEGAGFALESDKVLLRGILAVGLKFGLDGAMYVTDWITGWDSKNRGRIWKLDTPATAGSAQRKDVQTLLGENFSDRAAGGVSTLLAHADMRVRQKAQFELVRRNDSATLTAAAKARENQLARVHAIWGLAQLARKNPTLAASLQPYLTDADAEIRAQAAKMLGDMRYAAAAPALMTMVGDAAARPRFFATEALGRLAHKPATPRIIAMLADNDDKDVYLRHAGGLALARIGDVPAIAALSTHQSKGVRIAAINALRRLRSAELAKFMADSDELIVQETARAINDDGGVEAALPALGTVLADTKSVSEPLLRRAINANLRVGTADALARLATFAGDSARPAAMRVEAVAALGVFPSPSPMDRVDGYYIGQPAARDSAAAQAAVLALMTGVDSTATTAYKVALAEAAGRLEIQAAAPLLFAQLKADSAAPVRIASLRALQALKVANIDAAMEIAVADSDATVRRAALTTLTALPIADAGKVASLTSVIRQGTVPDQQAGFEALGTLKSADAERALDGFFDELAAGKLAPAVQLDLVDAMQASGSAKLQERLDAYQKSRGADTLVMAFKDAALAGGNVGRGRELFVEHPAAACTRCHTVRNAGSDVGPNLTGVATRLSRDLILESLVDPNAKVAPGFGTVAVTLRNGQKVDGTLKEETAAELVVTTGTPAVERRIAKTDIAERTNPVSAMPPVGAILKPREVRDVVAYLATLK